jgi:hypothetical protein
MQLQLEDRDFTRIKQLTTLLGNCQHKLVGVEVFAAAQVYNWVNKLEERMEAVKNQPPPNSTKTSGASEESKGGSQVAPDKKPTTKPTTRKTKGTK